MSESYCLFLNTDSNVNVVNTNGGQYKTFYVNWESFLPTKYEFYKVSWSFGANETYDGSRDYLFTFGMNFGTPYNNNQVYGGTEIMGSSGLITYTTTSSGTGGSRRVQASRPYENMSTTIQYPKNNFLDFKLYNNGNLVTGSNRMLVFLTFRPIKPRIPTHIIIKKRKEKKEKAELVHFQGRSLFN